MKKPIKTILCPIDFSDASSDALRTAIELAGQFNARVEVAHAVDVPYPSTPVIAEGFRKHAEETLADFIRHWPKTDVELTSALLNGAPAGAIAKHAGKIDADLIVISTHGRSGITRAMLGSVAERLVRVAPCPVLTVPAPRAQ